MYRELVPIQQVQAADRVWSYNHVVGKWKLCPVLETYQHNHIGDMVAVTIAGEVIESTSHHPWWVVQGMNLEQRPRPEHVPFNPEGYDGEGRWVDAIDLRVGDVLLLRSDEQAAITRISIRQACVPVFNFQVDEFHCYAVGSVQVLVHNNSLEDAINRGMRVLRGPKAPDEMVSVMENLGKPMTREKIREVIHKVKLKMNIGAAEDVVFDYSGGMWDSRTGEFLGKMWEW